MEFLLKVSSQEKLGLLLLLLLLAYMKETLNDSSEMILFCITENTQQVENFIWLTMFYTKTGSVDTVGSFVERERTIYMELKGNVDDINVIR